VHAGGRRGIYGNLTRIATGPVDDLSTPGITMVATGITPEAIEQVRRRNTMRCDATRCDAMLCAVMQCNAMRNDASRGFGTAVLVRQNPVIYELMSEMGWRSTSPPVDEWVQYYVSRRYGAYSPSAQAAWSLLLNGVYDVVRALQRMWCPLLFDRPRGVGILLPE
jgi:hypothetical protein